MSKKQTIEAFTANIIYINSTKGANALLREFFIFFHLISFSFVFFCFLLFSFAFANIHNGICEYTSRISHCCFFKCLKRFVLFRIIWTQFSYQFAALEKIDQAFKHYKKLQIQHYDIP